VDLGRWQEIKETVKEALDLPPEERRAFLAEIRDEVLRAEAEALLAVSESRVEVFEHYQAIPVRAETPVFREGEGVGQYTIIRKLGEGGMSSVYLAEDGKHARRVALKILSGRSALPTAEEHRILSRLTHPNIATLYDSGTTEQDLRYVVMEFVEGSSIAVYCQEHAASFELRLGLFLKVCAAVAYAHRRLVAHRDLKPSNILVTADGEPKLLDFGIAKLLAPESAALITGRDERPLTVAFASPEQINGEPTTAATDIYSLGVLLCVLLTGRLPYQVKYYYDLPSAIRNHEAYRPSDLLETEDEESYLPGEEVTTKPFITSRQLTGDLDAIVLKALRKESERRYR